MLIVQEGCKERFLDKLIPLFPKKTVFVEPFMGTGSIFLNADGFKRYIVNDHNRDIYWTYLVLATERGRNLVREKFEKFPFYYDLYKSYPINSVVDKVVLYLIKSRAEIRDSRTFRLTSKANSMKLFDEFIDKYQMRAGLGMVHCFDYKKFLKTLSRKDNKQTFAYIDPPYVFNPGNLRSNKNFSQKDLDYLINFFIDYGCDFMISFAEKSLDYMKKFDLKIIKIADVKRVVPTGVISSSEYVAVNYDPPNYELWK